MVERSFNLTGVGEPERLDGRRVSANLFDVLAVPPLIGRTFVPDDDRLGTHVVLLSYRLWQRRFGSDPSIIGRAVTLNGENYTVIGVMQRGCTCQAMATGMTSCGYRSILQTRK